MFTAKVKAATSTKKSSHQVHLCLFLKMEN